MKQKQLLKPLFLLFALLVGGLNSLWAEDVYSTCLFGSSYNSQKVSSYTDTWTTTNRGFTWSIANGNNNNNGWTFVKFGSKNAESVGSITNSAAYTEAITKVVLTIDAITADNIINSIKLYTSSDNSTWTEAGSFNKASGTQSVSLSSPTKNLYYKIEFDCKKGSSNGFITVSKVEYYYEANTSDTRTATTTTIDDAGITNTNVFDGTAAGSLSASVTAGETSVTGATVTWSGSDDAVATIDATGAVTLVGAGTVTFTAAYAGDKTNYKPSSATYKMTVTNDDPNAPGTETNPYTVAQAIEYINTLGSSTSPSEIYVSGIVSQVDSYSSNYKSITYWISDDGNTTTQMEVFSGKGLNGAEFSSIDDLAVGDKVTVKGYVKKFNSTPEFDKNNILVKFERPTTPIITASDVELTYDATSGEIAYSINNPVTEISLTATTTASWITDITVGTDKVTFTTTANEGATDRTATITLSYTGATNKEITVTQAHYVAEVATLPFNWEGGASSELLNTAGVTANGLGSDYGTSNSPYLVKFDTTGDYIQVRTDGQPGKVTIGVKMIGGGNTSSIKVQGSADGETFTDVETLSISGSQNSTLTLETTKPFAADVRYVRLVFTKGSNVGVGAITIAKPSTDPEIIADSEVELTYDATSGEVAYEVANAVAGVSLTATTNADWISNIIVAADKVTFTTTANEGTTDRTATITLSYTGATNKAITITQAHLVADYATLPFEYDGNGSGTLPDGLTQSGLGTYSSSPAMKFDGTGDELVLKINEAPGKLTFDIKGNSFSGGTFTLQASADGETYTDVATYTELGDTQNEVITTLDSNVRYIKWVYTKKSLGNVGLGNIKLDKPITVSISSVGYKAYNTTTDTDFSGTGVTAYVVTGYTTESVTLTEVTAVPARTPLVLKAKEGVYTLIAAEETPAAPAKNLLQVSNGTVGDGATIYALANVNGPGFYVVKSGLTIPTNYIVIPAGNAPALSFDFGEGTTGIRSIENGQLTIDNVYYDLSGRKLNAMPTQKGVYIVNGKKVVIK